MRVAIINQPLANRGDEAAHKAFMRSLVKRFPDWEFDVVFLNEKQELIDAIKVDGVGYVNVSGFSNKFLRAEQVGFVLDNIGISFIHPLLRKLKNRIKEYNFVICAPGGINLGGFLSWDHAWQLLLAERLHKKVYYWGRSIGPFWNDSYRHRLFTDNAKRILAYSSFIALRDSKSVKVCRELGFDCTEVVDSAFLEIPEARIPDSILGEIGNSKYVVFVPNELRWHFRYKNADKSKIDDFHLSVINLVAQKYPEHKIVMLPQTYNSDINDYDYFKSLAEKFGNKNIIVIDENQSSDIQQKIISGAELVIGERYHSIVFAINNNIPFISLSYEHKMTGLLEKLGLMDFSVDVESIFDDGKDADYKNALTQVEKLLINPPMPNPKINPKEFVTEGFEKMCRKIESEILK